MHLLEYCQVSCRPSVCLLVGQERLLLGPWALMLFAPLALLFSLTPAGLLTVVLRLDVLWLTSQPHEDGDGSGPPHSVAGRSEFPILLHAASHT